MRAIVIIIGILALLLGGYGVASGWRPLAAAQANPTPIPTPASAAGIVYAQARLVPAQRFELDFATSGEVLEVLVHQGDQVAAGAVLARLDDAAQRARVAARETELAEAQANYQKIAQGAAPEELRAAEAAVAQAQAQLDQAVSSVTAADLRAADAQLAQARALLARLRAGPDADQLQAAVATLEQSQRTLDSQRATLSAAKTGAQLQLEQASNSLKQAQASYSTAKWNWEQADATGNDPIVPELTSAAGARTPNRLTDGQLQRYFDAYQQAELALRSAEQEQQRAQVALQSALQAEATGIAAAEQAVAAAQAQLDQVRRSVTPDQIAGAQAQLAGAEAQQDRLRGTQRELALEAARAGLERARANLDLLRAIPDPNELTVARAQVASAEAALKLEQILLDQHVLRSPIAGSVAALDLRAGMYITPGVVAARVADLTRWEVETQDLTELSAARIRAEMPVTVTIDALPGLVLPGTVADVRLFGDQRQGDIVYTATIALSQADPRLRWNMTATVAFAP